jgi:hypothetical protein
MSKPQTEQKINRVAKKKTKQQQNEKIIKIIT